MLKDLIDRFDVNPSVVFVKPLEPIKFKRLTPTAQLPTRGSSQAAGYDLYADTQEDIWICPHETVKINTGLAAAIPEGYFGAIFARSGLATKQGLRPANAVGVVDVDYRGPIIVALHNDTTELQLVQAGTRIAQLVVMPYLDFEIQEVDELDDTERGDSGFGSTGVK